MKPLLTSFRIQKFLGGLRYPARKAQVLERAHQRGADEAVMSALRRLPDHAWTARSRYRAGSGALPDPVLSFA
jgi:hypothetical protein